MLNGNEADIKMGIEILSKTGDNAFSDILIALSTGKDPELKAWAISGLSKMKHKAFVDILKTSLEDTSPQVRRAAIEAANVLGNIIPIKMLVPHLTDSDSNIRSRAAQLIQRREKDALPELLSALHLDSFVLTKEILKILDFIGVPAAMLSSFITNKLESAYRCLAQIQFLESVPLSPALALCRDHLLEKNNDIIEIVLRGLGSTVFGDRMKLIIRAIQSGEKRDVDIAVEVLENNLHADIRCLLLPLLGERTTEEKVAAVRLKLKDDLPMVSSLEELLKGFINDPDPMIQSLGFYGLGESTIDESLLPEIGRHMNSENKMVKEAAIWAIGALEAGANIKYRSKGSSPMVDRIQKIRQISLFTGLRVQELFTIASMMVLRRYSKNDVVIYESMPYDCLYLICEGQVSLIAGIGTSRQKVLECMGKYQFFGELALIDGKKHPYTARVESDTQILMLPADDFSFLLKNFPAITLNLCNVLIQIIRNYQGRLEQPKIAPMQD